MSKSEIDILKRALERQVRARKQAERILEKKSKELYDVQHYLREDNNRLKNLLKEKTSELEGVFYNIPDPYLVIDLEGNVVKMNTSAKEFSGYDIDIEPICVFQLVHLDYIEETLNSFEMFQETGILKNLKTKVILKNGESKFVQVHANLIYNAEGKPVAAHGIIRDVSADEEISNILEEQKVKLKDSESRLATVISSLQFGVLLEDENRKIALTNPIFCDMFGMPATPEELVGVDCSGAAEQSKVYFKNPVSFVRRINQLLKEKKPVIGDELHTVSGQVLQRDFIPIFNGDTYKGHLWVYKDITITKKYKDNLQAQKEKYSSIIANMNLGLVEVDNEDRVQFINKSYTALCGFSEKELLGQKITDLVIVSDTSIISKRNKKRLEGDSDTYEVNVTIKDGSKRRWLISGAPRYNEKGVVIGSIGIHLDITDRYELGLQKEALLKELEISNVGLQEYAHVVSHDLKSPLRSISALASWLAEDYGEKLGLKGMEQLNLMQDKITVMDNLIKGILKYSSVGSEKGNFVDFSVEELIWEVKESMLWPKHVKLSLQDPLPKIRADKTQIQQLFQNLLCNAVTYNDKAEGLIQIGFEQDSQFYKFYIKDNGMGIKKEYHQKIFEVFQSLGNNSSSTGIGLSIVKKVIQNHSGTISLESEPNKGTTFYFTLKKHIS